MAIKVKRGDEVIDVSPDDLEFGDGYALITPESVPKGYFTQEALNKTIQERLERDREKQREKLLSDDSVKRQILSEYNISLDDQGKPKGLKPDFDPDEWKKNKMKEITEPYEQKLTEAQKQMDRYKSGLVNSEILKSASPLFREEYLQGFTGSDDPFVVKQFSDQFDVDESGTVALKDKGGGFAVDNDGSRITPSKFFESNREKFASLLKDSRQRGTGTNPGGATNGSFTREQIGKMTPEEFKKNEAAINKAVSEGRIQ